MTRWAQRGRVSAGHGAGLQRPRPGGRSRRMDAGQRPRLGQADVWVRDQGNGKFLTGVLMRHKYLFSGRWGPQCERVPSVWGDPGWGEQQAASEWGRCDGDKLPRGRLAPSRR